MYVNRAIESLRIFTRKGGEQLSTRQDVTGTLHQGNEERVFTASELDITTVRSHTPGREVYVNRAP